MTTLPAIQCMAAHCRPRSATFAYQLVLVAIGSIAIAASAYVVFPLPMSPVPVTAQTFVVLLVGTLYGSRLGAATVLAYLLQGAMGLPVFAGGIGGFQQLLGHTGGYLLGFVPAAFVIGWLAERGWDRRPMTAAIAMTIGTIVLFIPGVLWLSTFVGLDHMLAAGLIPFLPGAVIKIAAATALLPLGWGVLGNLERRFRLR